MNPTRRCPKCSRELPATHDYFSKGPHEQALSSWCKDCHNVAGRAWYRAHREHVLQRTKAYAAAHPEQRRQKVRNYRLRHPERTKHQKAQTHEKRRQNGKAREEYLRRKVSGRLAEAQKRYYENHPGISKVHQAKHVKKLKAQGLTVYTRWKKNHPDHAANRTRIRTIGRQEMKALGITAMGLYERDAGKCHLCHRKVARYKFSIDHIIPKSKGGPNTWENLAIAHLKCNIKRGVDRMPAQYRLF